jgi:hypothetical protein
MPSGIGEMFQRKRGRNFKERWMRLPIGDELANIRQASRDFNFRNHFAVYADALAERDQVRGGEESGPIVLGTADRIDHRADGAFAIGTGDVNDARIAKIGVQFGDQPPDIFQPEFDPETLKAVEPGERLGV